MLPITPCPFRCRRYPNTFHMYVASIRLLYLYNHDIHHILYMYAELKGLFLQRANGSSLYNIRPTSQWRRVT